MSRGFRSPLLVLFILIACTSAHAQQKKLPNVVVIFGDDSGIREGERSNIQCFDASSFTDGARHELPRWWSFSFGMHLVLPPRGSRAASRSR